MEKTTQFCAILSIRYLNAHLMGPAHDWAAQNLTDMPDGVSAVRSFHVAPDRGLTIVWFDTQEQLDADYSGLVEFQNEIAKRFEAKTESRKGITSSEYDFGQP